jgi:hypothetical protein
MPPYPSKPKAKEPASAQDDATDSKGKAPAAPAEPFFESYCRRSTAGTCSSYRMFRDFLVDSGKSPTFSATDELLKPRELDVHEFETLTKATTDFVTSASRSADVPKPEVERVIHQTKVIKEAVERKERNDAVKRRATGEYWGSWVPLPGTKWLFGTVAEEQCGISNRVRYILMRKTLEDAATEAEHALASRATPKPQ